MFRICRFFLFAVSFCAVFSGCTMDGFSSHQIGHYSGNLPCADCPGIFTNLYLTEKAQYRLEMIYTGRSTTAIEKGVWRIVKEKDQTGKMKTIIELSPFESSSKTLYHLKNNTTMQLLDSGKIPVESAVLKKQVN